MGVYTVYRHPSKGFKAVRHGFSIPALILNSFWLYMYKLWMPFWATTGINVALWMLSASFDSKFLAFVAFAGTGIVCGVFGNAWLRGGMDALGYDYIVETSAKSAHAAIQKGVRERMDKEAGYNFR
jgi:hypothetical protein